MLRTGVVINVKHNIQINQVCTAQGKGANANILKHYNLDKSVSRARNRLEETPQLSFIRAGVASVAAATS